MKRTSALIASSLIISIGLSFTGCNKPIEPATKSSSITKVQTPTKAPDKETKYELKTETFTKNKIVINYPQLINSSDSTAQDKINEIIKKDALRDKETLLKETDDVTYELKYNVMYTTPNLLSVKYIGYSSYSGAAHPNNFLFTTNIDIKKQNLIALKDIINIDESFVDLFKNGKYISTQTENTPELITALKEELNQTDTKEWVKKLNSADTKDVDNSNGVYSYLTKDSLVISTEVSHAIGDYAEFEINFKDLSKYKSDNEIWKEF